MLGGTCQSRHALGLVLAASHLLRQVHLSPSLKGNQSKPAVMLLWREDSGISPLHNSRNDVFVSKSFSLIRFWGQDFRKATPRDGSLSTGAQCIAPALLWKPHDQKDPSKWNLEVCSTFHPTSSLGLAPSTFAGAGYECLGTYEGGPQGTVEGRCLCYAIMLEIRHEANIWDILAISDA